MNDLNRDKADILLIGIGNTGRSDDGLGWQLADRLVDMGLPGMDIEYRYQLQVEDALMVCDYRVVIFADASKEVLEEGFALKPCTPSAHYFYSSHMQSPETILYLAQALYQHQPEAYTLAIAGEEWELGSQLSEAATHNLEKSLVHFLEAWPTLLKPQMAEKE
jgi:hydrogenase maturation protease